MRPETEDGQMQAYWDIRATLGDLLLNEQLWQEPVPGIFIYEVIHHGYRQTGIWALTSLKDYREGKIRLHELTLGDNVRRIKNYRENTRLEGSPVLLAHHPDPLISSLIENAKLNAPKASLGNHRALHKLWKVEDADVNQKLIKAFARLGKVYLADGHHRLESAAQLAKMQRSERLPVFDHVSSLYMATDQIRIEPYHRVVIPDSPFDQASALRQVTERFHVRESTGNRPVNPDDEHRMGMCLGGSWYHLLPKSFISTSGWARTLLDAEILQEHLLSPVFSISDPKTDKRLICAGGEKALEEICAILHANPLAVAFTLCPMRVEALIKVADEGNILPPKATWIVPKVPYGLLIHQHDEN
ncbi:MAG: DUF1015 domain-containing protein [Bacteroidetes bacterium]|nr:DUF1015 domain-containing protein [Bacteroidota bacterium]